MSKFNIIHFVKTIVFCNGMASLCGSALIFLFVMMTDSDKSYAYITALIYFVMAIMAGNLASKGLPKNPVAKWLPVLIPLTVTAVMWTLCYAVSGGSVEAMNGNGMFNVYFATQFTHATAITFASASGGMWAALWLPALYNAMFIAAFAYFEKLPAKAYKAKGSNSVPTEPEPEFAETDDTSHEATKRFTLGQLWIAFGSIIAICAAVCLFFASINK